MKRSPLAVLFVWALLPIFWGCSPPAEKQARSPEEALETVRYFLPSFHDDLDISSLEHAIRQSLAYLDRLNPKTVFPYGPHPYPAFQVRDTLTTFLELIHKYPEPKILRKEIKKRFRVYKSTGRSGKGQLLFTGYFEPIYEGSPHPDEIFKYPLYRKPEDLITIDLSLFRNEFKGKRIIARINDKRVLPYYSRSDIEMEQALNGRNLEIAWLKDPVDVAFLQIQGSGRLRFRDGRTIQVGYEASNGRPYKSIGRYLIDQGYMSREEVSMQSIRQFLAEHPKIIEKVLNYNPSYVFFRGLEEGPLGNINVPLTPGRSIALDSRLFPKGALCFISSKKPLLDEEGHIREWVDFSRFALNQDTGGAIKGAGRADLFWGSGAYAELGAGHMKHAGELYVLIKKPES